MKEKKQRIVIFITLIILITSIFLLIKKATKYNIKSPVKNYNLRNAKIKNEYLNYLKEKIYPIEIRNFIDNDFVPISILGEEANGETVIYLMKEIGYEILFNSLFDKDRTSFDDCLVSKNFKEKYSKNLLDYYNLKHSNNCVIDCVVNQTKKILIVELYDDFKNTEPTSHKTYHFHYTLDNDGNVDNIELKNYEN